MDLFLWAVSLLIVGGAGFWLGMRFRDEVEDHPTPGEASMLARLRGRGMV